MKANFNIKKNLETNVDVEKNKDNEDSKKLTQAEFEAFIIKSGAKGSFMVYRSDKKDEELGLEEL
ncbi:MAG TPA: hypothetical protein VEU72_03140 [Nitrosopumilaceae archaeon]|nr:hypothetical protein [Nitrosopumilaceae archaeon]